MKVVKSFLGAECVGFNCWRIASLGLVLFFVPLSLCLHTHTHICILLLLNSFFRVLVFCNMELYSLRMFPLMSPLHSHRASQMALAVKNLPANAGDMRPGFDP